MGDWSRNAMWLFVATYAALLHLLLVASGVTIDWGRATLTLSSIVIVLVGRATRRWFQSDALTTLLSIGERWAQFGLVAMLGGFTSYLVAAHTTGWSDPALLAADHSLGLDWLSWHALALRSPVFHFLCQIGYGSIYQTPLIAIAACVLLGREQRAGTFVAATAVALALTLTIFAYLPALSAVPYLIGLNPAVLPSAGVSHVAIIEGLRDGTITTIDASNMVGLITFPSFHAATALLYTWVCWPLRPLRWPMAMFNGLMLVATPLEGSHYFIDVIGGLAVAAVAILTVCGWERAGRWWSTRVQPRKPACGPSQLPAGEGVMLPVG